MKSAPTKAAILLRIKLNALASRGVGGEAESALRKLVRLEARYDFAASAPCEQQKGDIFAGFAFDVRSRTARHLSDFAACDSDLAAFVQWAIARGFGVESALRTLPDWSLSVWVEADWRAMVRLSEVASIISRTFRELWAQFSTAPGVDPACRRVFYLGLYDGMMGDEKREGEALPAIPAAKVRKGRRRSLALAPGLAVHPYTLAAELGAGIRLSVPVSDLGEVIESRVAPQQLAA